MERRTKEDTQKALDGLQKAVQEYHATLLDGDTFPNSIPMTFIVVYSATAIDEEGDQVWGNQIAMSRGVDPNSVHGLASWALGITDSSGNEYGDDEED